MQIARIIPFTKEPKKVDFLTQEEILKVNK